MNRSLLLLLLIYNASNALIAQKTQKPPLHGKNWMAVTGKPLAATAGSIIFQKGGNAVDAACAMLAATCTMWDELSWGGETQALIFNPKTKKVIAIKALGVAPTGATVAFFKDKGYNFPPEFGPLAAVTPGTTGGLCYMLAEYGTMSLKEVLEPAMQMAAGYPIDAETANKMERHKKMISEWPYSKKIFLPHTGEKREAPEAGEIFVQKDLLVTLTKMVDAEQEALMLNKSRREAIMAASDRFYKGDIAEEFARGCKEQGGLITTQDLAGWKPVEEEPLHVDYKGIDVYKLAQWTQGPVLLQSLNILENFDLKKMGYNSSRYIHTIYQTMNLAFADRDFYYGDPSFPPEEPIKGLLSKEYAKSRASQISFDKNDANAGPGNPYPFEGKQNPYGQLLKKRSTYTDSPNKKPVATISKPGRVVLDSKQKAGRDQGSQARASGNSKAPGPAGSVGLDEARYHDRLWRGTTSVEAADKEGWVVSITPSGGWLPACIAGNTGIGMSQRMQSFVLDSTINPFNVLEPGKHPRVTLTPSLALKEGKPFLSFAVQGGDTQDQNLLQLFLNIVEFNMTVQQACEAPNINTNQIWLSLGGTKLSDRLPKPGKILLDNKTPPNVRSELVKMGYIPSYGDRTTGPINAIFFDWKHGSFWGGSSNNGEDYGIGW